MSNDQTPTAQDNPQAHVIHVFIEGSVGADLANILELLKERGSLILCGGEITLQDINNIRALLRANGYGSFHDFGSSSVSPPTVYIAANRIPTIHDAVAAGEDDLFAYSAQNEREFFEQICMELGREEIDTEMGMVTAFIRLDEGYRMGWVANLAQAFIAEGVEHYTAQKGAARFLEVLAHVDAREDESFQHRPVQETTELLKDPRAIQEHEQPYLKIEVPLDEYQIYQVAQYVSELRHLLGLPNELVLSTGTKPRARVRENGHIEATDKVTKLARASQLINLITTMPAEARAPLYPAQAKFMQLINLASQIGAENVWFNLLDD